MKFSCCIIIALATRPLKVVAWLLFCLRVVMVIMIIIDRYAEC